MPVVIDTNVLIAANGRDCPQATLACRLACTKQLQQTRTKDILVIDSDWHIISQYKKQVSQSGQPGVGDAFLKWVLTNRNNLRRCVQVQITPTADGSSFAEFPMTPELESFDRDEHKFVAAALVHPDTPPIYNAVDSDWKIYFDALTAAGVKIVQLCPEALKDA